MSRAAGRKAASLFGRRIGWLGIFVFLIGSAKVAHADIDYVLNSGSTITPLSTGSPSGPAEALTGSFSWAQDPSGSLATEEAFAATSLDFTSSSYTLTLGSDPTDTLESNTFTNGNTFFGANISTADFSGSDLVLQGSTSGSYTGSYLSPTSLAYTDIDIVPVEGGGFEAEINFTATAVPEPTTLAPVLLMLFGLNARRFKLARA
jgi:hypothetical protein